MPTILHKRRTSDNTAPTTSNLSVGELAINVVSGKLYIVKQTDAADAGTKSIVEIGSTVQTDDAFTVNKASPSANEILFAVQNNGTSKFTVDEDGDVVIKGGLTVEGTNTVVESTTLTVTDKSIELAVPSSGSASDTAADGGGIILKGSSDKTILWENDTDTWHYNQGINLTSGYLGIGFSSAPTSPVHVNLSSSATYAGIFYNSHASGEGVTIRGGSTSSQNSLIVQNNDGSKNIIIARSDGNVGIGTVSPGAELEVNGEVLLPNNKGILFKDSSSSTLGIKSDTSDRLAFRTGGNWNRMVITSGGSVGVGTTTPSARLDIQDGNIALVVGADNGAGTLTNSTTKTARVGVHHYTNAEEPMAIFVADSQSTTGTLSIGGATSSMNATSFIKFFTATNGTTVTGTQRMMIDNSGNVGIGTNLSPSKKFHVDTGEAELTFHNDASGSNGNLRIWRNDTSITAGNPLGYLSFAGSDAAAAPTDHATIYADAAGTHASGDNPTNLKFQTTADGAGSPADRMTIRYDGNVGIGTTNPTSKLALGTTGVYSGGLSIKSTTADAYGIVVVASANDRWLRMGHDGTKGVIETTYQSSGGFSDLYVRAGSTNDLILQDDGGKVGIGEDSPVSKLHVNESGGAELAITRTTGSTTGQLGFIRFGNTNVDSEMGGIKMFQDGQTNSSRMEFWTQVAAAGSDKRITIDQHGNVYQHGGSPEYHFETGASHYNWRIAVQEAVDGGFEIASGSQDADASNDTYTNRLVIKGDTGNVGLGKTPASTYKLDVEGNIDADFVRVTGLGSGEGMAFQNASANDSFYLTNTGASGTSALRLGDGVWVNEAGNIGIGNSDFDAKLEVYGNTNGDAKLGHFWNNNTGTAAESTIYITNSSALDTGLFLEATGSGFTTTGGFVQDGAVIGSGTGAGGGLSIMARADADMRFYTNGHTNQRMIIKNDGDVGIGNSAPAAMLHVGDGNDANTMIRIEDHVYFQNNADWARLNSYWGFRVSVDGSELHLEIDRSGNHDHKGNRTVNSQTITDLQVDSSYRFDGSNDGISLPTLMADGFTAYSIEVTFKCTETPVAGLDMITGYKTGHYWWMGRDSNNKLHAQYRDSDGNYRSTVSTSTIPLAEWNHAVYTVEKGSQRLYLNGVLEASSSFTGEMNSGVFAAYIGRYTSGDYFTGEISKARYYDRILSAAEVKAAYNGQPTPYKYTDSDQTQKIVNGTMESSLSTGWNVETGLTMAQSSTTRSGGGGSYSANIYGTTGSGDEFFQNMTGATIGKRYLVSFWAYNNSGRQFYARETYSYAANYATADHARINIPSNNTWTFYQAEFTSASTNTQWSFYLNGTVTSGQFLIDDVSITRAGCVAEYLPQSIEGIKWNDTSGNNLDGTVSGAIATNDSISVSSSMFGYAWNKTVAASNSQRAIGTWQGKDSSGNVVDMRVASVADATQGAIYTFTNHKLTFATNNAAPQITLNTNGHLSIGPNFVGDVGLHVRGASNTSSALVLENNYSGASKYWKFQPVYNDDKLQIGYDASMTPVLTIKDDGAGGKVGIGNQAGTPYARLHVANASANTADMSTSTPEIMKISNTNNANSNWSLINFSFPANDINGLIGAQLTNASNGTADLVFGTRNAGSLTEKLRISSLGVFDFGKGPIINSQTITELQSPSSVRFDRHVNHTSNTQTSAVWVPSTEQTLLGKQPFTIEVRFKTSFSTSGTYYQTLIGQTNGFWLYLMGSTQFRLWVGGTVHNFAAGWVSNHVFNDGKWHHVTITRGYNGYTYLYLDGKYVAMTNAFDGVSGGATPHSTNALGFGQGGGSTDNGLDGEISLVRIGNFWSQEDRVRKMYAGETIEYAFTNGSNTNLLSRTDSEFDATDTENTWSGNQNATFNYNSGDSGHASTLRIGPNSGSGTWYHSAIQIPTVPEKRYEINFDYKHIGGVANTNKILITDAASGSTVYAGDINSTSGWVNKVGDFTTIGDNIWVHFYASYTDSPNSADEVLFDNLFVRRKGITAEYLPQNITEKYWIDSSGNENHGHLMDGAHASSHEVNIVGEGTGLLGSETLANLNSGASWYFNGGQGRLTTVTDGINFNSPSYTYETWFKTTQTSSSYLALLGGTWSSTDLEMGLGIGSAGQIFVNSYRHNASGAQQAAAGVYVNDDKWHHAAVVVRDQIWDGHEFTNIVELYVDGVCVRTRRGIYTYNNPGHLQRQGQIEIGSRFGAGNFFNGEIRMARYHNRALSKTEIKDSYNGKSIPYKYRKASFENVLDIDTSYLDNGLGRWSHSGAGSLTHDASNENVDISVTTSGYVYTDIPLYDDSYSTVFEGEHYLEYGQTYRVRATMEAVGGYGYSLRYLNTSNNYVEFYRSSRPGFDFEWTLPTDYKSPTGFIAIYSNSGTTTITGFDNFEIIPVGVVAEYLPENISEFGWIDSTQNGFDLINPYQALTYPINHESNTPVDGKGLTVGNRGYQGHTEKSLVRIKNRGDTSIPSNNHSIEWPGSGTIANQLVWSKGFTAEAKFTLNREPLGQAVIFGKGTPCSSSNNYVWGLKVWGQAGNRGNLGFSISADYGTGNSNTSYSGVHSSRAYFKPGETYHVVGVWDGGNHYGSLRIYINGVCVGMDRGNIALSSITQMSDAAGMRLCAGVDGQAARYGLDAEYHLLRLHNRPLSDTEIRQSYLGQEIPYKHSNASNTELIGEQTNRDFSSGIGDWAGTGSGSSLTVTNGELVRVQAGGHTTHRGEGLNGFAHRMWLNWASDSGGGAAGRFTERVHQISFDAYHTGDNKARLYVHDSNEALGVGQEKYVDITTTKTRYTVELNALHDEYAASGQYILFGLANPGTFKLDNISYTHAGCYMDLNSDGITDGYWMDSTGNGNNATVSNGETINYELPALTINPTNAASGQSVLTVPGTTRISGTNYTFATGTNNFFNYREWRVNTGSSGGAIIRNDGSAGITLQSGSGNGIFIDSSNNVVIGATAAVSKLHVDESGGGVLSLTRTTGSTTGDLGYLRFGNTNVDSEMGGIKMFQDGHTNSSRLEIWTQNTGGSSSVKVAVDRSGFVGIGNDDPDYFLDIKGTSGTSTILNKLWNTNTSWDAYALVRGVSDTQSVGQPAADWGFYRGNSTDGNAASGFVIKTGANNGTTVKMKVDWNGHVTPGADNTQDLGSSSKRWANLHVGDVQLNNEGSGGNEIDGTEGKWTIQEGEEDLFIVNRKSGKKYKFKLEEVE